MLDRKQHSEVFGNLWVEVFGVFGDSHRARGGALGITDGAAADRARGRSLPDKTTRALFCLSALALRSQKSEAARRKMVEQALEMMRAIEGGDLSLVQPAPPRPPGRPRKDSGARSSPIKPR